MNFCAHLLRAFALRLVSLLFSALLFSALLLLPQNLSAQTNITDSLVHQGHQRKYMVHLPPATNAMTKRPLVVNLHGGSGNMINAQGFTLMNPVADQQGFVVAWPQGFGIAPPGFSWADGRNTSADQAGIDDVVFIQKLLDKLIPLYNIDTNRLYICGFSNGGFMVQRIACETPGRFAAMAGLGCSMDTDLFRLCKPAKPIPMAYFNGTNDPAMPYNGGRLQNPEVKPVVPVDTAVRFWVRQNQCRTVILPVNLPDIFPADSSTVQVLNFTNCQCNANVRFFRLLNGGHTWPGVFVPAQAAALGNTNRDINGSVEVWNFFRAHTLCQNSSTSVADNSSPVHDADVSIIPNPVSEMLLLHNAADISRITLYNVLGQRVLEQEILQHHHDLRVDVAHVPNGVYYVQYQTRIGIRTHAVQIRH
jgi:polyhydroxybutyrate depolymerase